MRLVEKASYARRTEHDAQSVDLQVAGNNRVAQSLYCLLRFEPVYGYRRRTQEGRLRNLPEWLEWRKAAGVEPTRERLTPPTGFEARPRHRARLPSLGKS